MLEFGWKLPIRTETSDSQPNFGFSVTSPVYASEIGVCVVLETFFDRQMDTFWSFGDAP